MVMISWRYDLIMQKVIRAKGNEFFDMDVQDCQNAYIVIESMDNNILSVYKNGGAKQLYKEKLDFCLDESIYYLVEFNYKKIQSVTPWEGMEIMEI